MKIALFENIHALASEEFRQRGHDVLSTSNSRDATSKSAWRDTEILGIRSRTHVSRESMESAPNLLAIGCFCIGTNQVDLKAARERGIVVFNAPYSNTRSVAELTIAEIIALHRRLFEKSDALHRGVWDKSAAHAHEVRGRTLGIIGYGHIGSQVSILAEALGMRLIFYDIVPKLPLGNAIPMGSLIEVLSWSDIVTVHVPETPATRGLIGRDQITLMKPGALLINNARGSVVDVEAVAEAIRSGHLGGAALDVFPHEPSSTEEMFESALRGLPNVILSPHIGGSTEEAQANIARDVTTKLLRYLEHGATTSAVNMPDVDLPHMRPQQHRILHFHRNVPGVLSKMHRILADLGININAEYLQSDMEISYVILDVDPVDHPAIIEGLKSIPETIRVRTLW